MAHGGSPTKQTPWHYTLLTGSELIDDCPACGRPTFSFPLRGSFGLQLLEENPLFATYLVTNVDFIASNGSGIQHRVTGRGTFRVGGEVALVQEMHLEVLIWPFESDTPYAQLETKLVPVERRWPMLQLELNQTNGTLLQTYHLRLAAAPFSEIWFSTARNFTSGTLPPSEAAVSAGDLLSNLGRPVRRNRELMRNLGIMPVVPDLGLDGVDVRPGGELAFTVEQSFTSERLGQLQHGDVLSDRGQLLVKNQLLLTAFGIQPPVPDLGLDAVQIVSESNGKPDEVWFSIEQEAFSERLGQRLQRGDVLSNRGQIIRSNRELLGRFKPAESGVDYGLDAFYVWSSGEVWFSTEKEFRGTDGQSYGDGDLLSDQGYVVAHNLELVRGLAPQEDLANFGLDALWLVTDDIPSVPPPRVTSFSLNEQTGTTTLRWDGLGRVFQVEGAPDIRGPYQPVSFVIPQLEYQDLGASRMSGIRFYRVRQW